MLICWGGPSTSKRYVLLVADGELSEAERKDLQAVLEARHGSVKLIFVRGNARAVIVRTTNDVVPLLRDPGRPLKVGGKKLETVLTSGAVGNLKRRASEATGHGQVPQ